MSDADMKTAAEARQRGRGEGLALAALAIGAGSFINLLSVEKSVLAICFAVLALRATKASGPRTQSWMAIALGTLQIVAVIAVLVLFHEKLGQFIKLLRDLS